MKRVVTPERDERPPMPVDTYTAALNCSFSTFSSTFGMITIAATLEPQWTMDRCGPQKSKNFPRILRILVVSDQQEQGMSG